MSASTAAREPRKTRRQERQDGRRARHLARYMAAETAHARLEAAWDYLRSVVARADERTVLEVADGMRRTADRLNKETGK